MSTYPRLEARVSAQERQQNILNARIEELSEDMTTNIKRLSDDMNASFKQLAEYQIKMEHQIDARFEEHTGILTEHTGILTEHTALITQILTRMDEQTALITQILTHLLKKP